MLVCFERITPDFIQYLYNDVLHNMASGVDAITQLDAGLERTRGVVEFVVELCFVSLILKKAGTRFCLSSSAATILSAVVLFALVGNPLFIVCAFHLDEGMRHAWFKSAKELTYTVTSRDVLYNIKPVIEMFFYRFARGFAGLAIYFTQVLHLGVKGVMALTALSSFVWLFAAFGLTREFERLEKEKATDLVSESSKKAAQDEKKATVETVV
ncbi:MAG: hypothetical protein BWY75_02568 [bacterium ADurb.Bin425]|nr:MAG: hypothetical protein BWY75_02568 [bacterium ADurb.Bin425]